VTPLERAVELLEQTQRHLTCCSDAENLSEEIDGFIETVRRPGPEPSDPG